MPPRRWIELALMWLASGAVLTAVAFLGNRYASPRDETDDLDRLALTVPGATWIYRVNQPGSAVRIHSLQVIGPSFAYVTSIDAEAWVLESRDYDAAGRPVGARSYVYLSREDDRLFFRGSRHGAKSSGTLPPRTLLRLPIRPGDGYTWTPESEPAPGEIAQAAARVVGVEPFDLFGTPRDDCVHLETTLELVGGDNARVNATVDDWLCPGVGTVRSREVAPQTDYLREEDLMAFRAPGISVGTELPPWFETAAPGSPASEQAGELDVARLAWSLNRRDRLDFPLIAAGETLFTADPDGGIAALDAKTGKSLWRVALAPPIVAAPVVAGPVIVAADADKSLVALDVISGLTRWALRLDDVPSAPPVAAGTTVIVPSQDRSLTAFDALTGEQRWSIRSDDLVFAQPVLHDGSVFVIDRSGRITTIDPATGHEIWSGSVDGAPVGDIVAAGDALAVLTDANTVYLLNAADGTLRWARRLAAGRATRPALSDQTVSVVVNEELVALDRANGEPLWTSPVGETIQPPIASAGRVAVLSEQGDLTIFSAADGVVVGSSHVGPAGEVTGAFSMVRLNGLLLAATRMEAPWIASNVYAFRDLAPHPGATVPTAGATFDYAARGVPYAPYGEPAQDGTTILAPTFDGAVWQLTPGDEPRQLFTDPLLASWLLTDGELAFSRHGSKVVARPIGGGDPLWTVEAGAPNPADLAALGAGTLYVVAPGTGLLALDTRTGAERWRFPVEGFEAYSAPLILPGGDVVFSAGGLMARLDPATGRPRWQWPFASFAGIVEHAGVLYYAAFGRTVVAAIDATSGSQLWAYDRPDELPLSVSAGFGVVLANFAGRRVVAIDARDGRALWDFEVNTSIVDRPRISGHVVLVAELGRSEDVLQRDFTLTALDLFTGGYLGSFGLPGTSFSPQSSLTPFGDGFLLPSNRFGETFVEFRLTNR